MILDELKTVLNYNPETGEFHWTIFRPRAQGLKKWPMSLAGTYSRKPKRKTYLNIAYKSMTYGCQRLAWFFYYGVLPPDGYIVDHIDGNTLNNRINNLRILTPSQNSKNIVKKTADGNPYCRCFL